NVVEELPVDVVESAARLAEPALGDKRSQQKGRLSLFLGDSGAFKPPSSRDQDTVSRLDLFEQLPEQKRHANHVDKTQHRMVVRSGELESLARPQTQRRVFTGMKDLRRFDRAPEPIKDVERNLPLGIRVESRMNIRNPERSGR